MSSAFRRTLPARPDLDQQRKLAKDLLRAFRRDEPDAVARMRAELPDKRALSLADAQFVLAREYGFESWRELRSHIEARVVESLPPIERFKRAVQTDDAASLGALLAESPEVRARVNDPIFAFNCPALVAASGRSVELVDVLLQYGADPNRKSDWWAGGFHPLYDAPPAVAERLLAAGAVPDACAAASLDRPDLLATMLAERPARVHERGGDGKMPLHFARSRRVADMLLDAGADIDARDLDHRSTAAEWMIGDPPDTGRPALARYFVERGATADIFLVAALGLTERATTLLEADRSLLNLRTSQGAYAERPPSSFHIYQWTIGPNLSPLQVAAKFGHEETLSAMERFASPIQRFMLACHRGDRASARRIVTEQPEIMQHLAPNDRRALADEAWAANGPAVELMLALGFDPALPAGPGHTGGTALHCAAWEGSVDCVTSILRYPTGRAIVDVRDRTHHGTPLGWCAHGSANAGNPRADHARVARILIEAGAMVEAGLANVGSDAFRAVIEDVLGTVG